MGNILHQVLYNPIFNALIFIYNHLAFYDFGIAIIILTVVIRGILAPLSYKNSKDQAIFQRLGPKIKEIQKNHKDNQEKQVAETMALYKEHKVNPMMMFFYLFVQILVFVNLYKVFQAGITTQTFSELYPFVQQPKVINYYFLGVFDLRESVANLNKAGKPAEEAGRSGSIWVLIIFTAVAQYFLAKLSSPRKTGNKAADSTAKIMPFVGAGATLLLLVFSPAAIAVYWLTTSAFSAIQQIMINKSLEKNGGIAKLS